MLTFEKITDDEGLQKNAALADEIWHEYFAFLLSPEQIDYMVEKFQSYDAMRSQLAQGYSYYGIFADGVQAGYFCVCEKPDNTLFLSKLYLKKVYRGKGFASKAFEAIKNIAAEKGNAMVWLTVNKHNDHSIDVYKHWGMELIRSEVTDIGCGFVMDDYVFGFKL